MQVKDDTWYDSSGKRRVVTQYHETIGYFLGDWAKYIVQILVIINLFGTNVSQVCANSCKRGAVACLLGMIEASLLDYICWLLSSVFIGLSMADNTARHSSCD